jgi:predicted Ser/Thr protein kinase
MDADERTVDERTQAVEGALRALADDGPEAARVEDIVAARLFTSVRPPVRVGRFGVLEVMGSGGMGTVYAAHDPELDRKVALKVVRSSPTSDEPPHAARSRLLREARVLARLTHPNVVTIHEHGIHEGQVFLVMELVDGVPLHEWLAVGTRPWTEIVELFLGAAEGLAAAHAIGIVHRDFKPANVLVGRDGRPRVVDFGLARPIAREPPASPRAAGARAAAIEYSITATGLVSGTPGYIAPELLAGAKASPRTDVYAFCIALLAALSPGSAQQGQGASARPQAIPGAVIDALLRGIAADPDARWPTMTPLIAVLRSASGSAARRGSPVREGEQAWRGLAALCVVLVAVVALDRLGVAAVFTAGRVLLLDVAALALVVLVLVRRSARHGTFAWVLAACLLGQLLNDATGWLLGRPLEHTMVSTVIGAAMLHGLAATLAERWLAWCAAAHLLVATLMLLAPAQLVIWYPLGYLASLLVAAGRAGPRR